MNNSVQLEYSQCVRFCDFFRSSEITGWGGEDAKWGTCSVAQETEHTSKSPAVRIISFQQGDNALIFWEHRGKWVRNTVCR